MPPLPGHGGRDGQDRNQGGQSRGEIDIMREQKMAMMKIDRLCLGETARGVDNRRDGSGSGRLVYWMRS